jgi:uncharacterized protein (DUF1778 family)
MTTTLSKPKAHAVSRTTGRKAARGKTQPNAAKDANLLVRFDRSGKTLVQRAAAARGLSVSDYVRTRIVPMARQDIAEADTGVLRLPREDQISFWQALQHPPAPTPAQRRLGELVRSVM